MEEDVKYTLFAMSGVIKKEIRLNLRTWFSILLIDLFYIFNFLLFLSFILLMCSLSLSLFSFPSCVSISSAVLLLFLCYRFIVLVFYIKIIQHVHQTDERLVSSHPFLRSSFHSRSRDPRPDHGQSLYRDPHEKYSQR